VAPPTFPIVVSLQAAEVAIFDPELGLDYRRVVHGEQRFAYARPVRPGDRLVATVTVESIRSAAGNDIVTTRTDISTTDGDPVVTAHSTLVARGTSPDGGQAS
jgi:acyl dehydratase